METGRSKLVFVFTAKKAKLGKNRFESYPQAVDAQLFNLV